MEQTFTKEELELLKGALCATIRRHNDITDMLYSFSLISAIHDESSKLQTLYNKIDDMLRPEDIGENPFEFIS